MKKNANEWVDNGLFKIKINDFAGALGCFAKATELNPKNGQAFKNKGFAEIKQADDPFDFYDVHGYTIAMNDFEKAIQIDPDDHESYFGYALAYFLGYPDADDVLKYIDKAIQINPEFDSAYHLRGMIKITSVDFKRGELDTVDVEKIMKDVIDDYNIAISLNPENISAYTARGELKDEMGDFAGALSDYNIAIEKDRLNEWAYYKRGSLKERNGDFNGACEDYEKSIIINPNNKSIQDDGQRLSGNFKFEKFAPIPSKKETFNYYYYIRYYPLRVEVIPFLDEIRKYIYDFKDGKNGDEVAYKLAKDFKAFSGLDEWWFCVIPASTKHKTKMRYENFCMKFCDVSKVFNKGMNNGYSLIFNTKDREPIRLHQRRDSVNILESIAFGDVEGKKILLFDDVFTTGNSFIRVATSLKEQGALEVVGLFLGRTHWLV